MNQTTPRLILYTSPGCTHCRRMKQWLRGRGLRFREEDVTRNTRAFREFQRLGGRGVPLLQAGNRVIRGFDPRRLERQLREAGVILG